MVLDDPKLVRLVAGITGGIEAPAQFILQVTILIHLKTNPNDQLLWILIESIEHLKCEKKNYFAS